MSKKKTNKKGENKMINENIEEVVKTNETVEENKDPEVITSTGQTKEDLEGNNEVAPVIEPELPDVEPAKPEDEESEEEIKPSGRAEGVVFGCTKLNVRIKPSKDSTVCYILNNGESVMVNLEESTEDFYKVYTINMDGYCMKQFIDIK